MKYFFAFVSGFFLTLLVFASGVALTIVYLTADPVPVRQFSASTSVPWTDEPARVASVRAAPNDSQPKSEETVTQAPFPSEALDDDPNANRSIDPVTTASAVPEAALQPTQALSAAHIAWCSERYRSYNPGDNRYNAYSGERRECISPFSNASVETNSPEQSTGIISASSEAAPAFESAFSAGETQEAQPEPEHIRSCFARYRSYRPADNTYQPYGGGPRRQCE